MRFRAIPFLLSATLAVNACTTAHEPAWSPAGTDWKITAIDGAAPAMPDKARIGFADDRRISASVGCNTISGGYRLEDGRLIAGPLISSLVGCEGNVAQDERALNALLSGAPQISHRGDTMQLDSGGHTVDLVRL